MTFMPRYVYIFTAFVFLILMLIDSLLRTEHIPYGIVSAQLCHFTESCHSLYTEYSFSQQILFSFGLGLDVVLIIGYVLSLILLLKHSCPNSTTFQKLLPFMIMLSFLAGISDIFENYSLLQLVLTEKVTFGQTASLYASIKFGLLVLVIIYIIAQASLKSKTRFPLSNLDK